MKFDIDFLIIGTLSLLAFINFTNPLNVNKRANFFFAIFISLWSTFWWDEIIPYLDISSLNILMHFVQFLAPIVFYLSVVFFINPNYKFQKKDFKHSFLPALYLMALILQVYYTTCKLLGIIAVVLLLFQAVFSSFLSYSKIHKYQKNMLLFSSNILETNLNWLKYISVVMLIVTIIVTILNIILTIPKLGTYNNYINLIGVFAITYFSLKQKEIYPIEENQRNELISINENSKLSTDKRKFFSDEDLILMIEKINVLMNEQKPYLDTELNLVKLANLLSITVHQLSYVINNGYNDNFYQFINKYRVERAKELLIDSTKSNLTILAIAFESGFNSKTTFNTTFKTLTNQTPTEFKKEIASKK